MDVITEEIYQKFKGKAILYNILKDSLGEEKAEKEFRKVFNNIMNKFIMGLNNMNELEEALKQPQASPLKKYAFKEAQKPFIERGVRMNKPKNTRPRGRG